MGENANWNFPDIDKVITGPTADQKLKYEVWHMNALVFGRWPDGEEIRIQNGESYGPWVGECAQEKWNRVENTCVLDSIHFSDTNTEHFGHFHAQPRR